MTPQRIQLSRRKGWRMPDNTVNVARPSKWGNPFSVAPTMTPGAKVCGRMYIAVPTVEDAVDCYRIWLAENPQGREVATEAAIELRGKHLACWCKPGELCHADVLLEYANREKVTP